MQKKTGLCPRISMFTSKSVSDGHTHSDRFYQKCTWTFCLLNGLYYFRKTKILSYASIGWLQKQISQIQTTFRFEIWPYSHWNIRFCRKTRQYRQQRYRYCCGIGETILVIDVWFERKSEEVIRMWSRFGEIQRFFAPNIEEQYSKWSNLCLKNHHIPLKIDWSK